MAFLYATRTIRLPVRAAGGDLLDAEGRRLATFEDSFRAEAIAMLVNAGQAPIEATEREHDYQEAALSRRLLAGRADANRTTPRMLIHRAQTEAYYATHTPEGLLKSQDES